MDGHQLGEDFTVLRKILSDSRFYRHARLYGPDVGQPQDHRTDILRGSVVRLSTQMFTKNFACKPLSFFLLEATWNVLLNRVLFLSYN